MLNLAVPSLLLSGLQLVAFLIPPSASERTSFSITLMLSLFVLQNQVLNAIPDSPKPTVAGCFLLAQVFFASVCALYFTTINYLVNTKKTKFVCFKCQCISIDLIDKLVFAFALCILTAIYLTCHFMWMDTSR